MAFVQVSGSRPVVRRRRPGPGLARPVVRAVLAALVTLGLAAATLPVAAAAGTASISGHVSVPAGYSAADVLVHVAPPRPALATYTRPAADGSWTVSGLAANSYSVGVDPGLTALIHTSWPGPITLGAGESVTGVNLTMQAGATLSGTIAWPAGAVFSTVFIQARALDPGLLSGWTQPSRDGSWTISRLKPGRYVLSFSATYQGQYTMAEQYYPWPSTTAANATVLQLGSEDAITDIVIDLRTGGHLGGRVTADDGSPVASADVLITSMDGGSVLSAVTDVTGRYADSGVGPGEYTVAVEPATASLLPQYWPGTTEFFGAGVITMVAGRDRPGLDVVLPRSGSIQGSVLVPPGESRYCVTASAVVGDWSVSDCFASGAPYLLEGLDAGSHVIQAYAGFSGLEMYLPGTARRSQADVLAVTAGRTTAAPALDLSGVGSRGWRVPNLALSSQPAAPVAGRPATVVVTAGGSSPVPTGVVELWDVDGFVADAELVSGAASFTYTFSEAGPAGLDAVYRGDASYGVVQGGLEVDVLPAPSVEPRAGSPLGGTAVVITAPGAGAATAVTFDGLPATGLTPVAADRVRVTAPAGGAGPAAVLVTTPTGTVGDLTYTYTPSVTGSPVRASADLATSPGSPHCVQVAGQFGVPAEATGVMLNVTVVRPTGSGYVVVYPDTAGTGATPEPGGSTVNFEPGADVANGAFVALPANGKVCYLTRGAASTGVLLDATGYVLPESGIVMQAATRLLDTRAGTQHVGTVVGPVQPRQVLTVDVAGRAGVPDDASAVVLNVTVTGTSGTGNLRVFPAGQEVPNTSVVNYAPYRDKANGTIVALPASGEVSFWSDSVAPVQVILDVVGYVAGQTTYVGVPPERVLDTRPGRGHIGTVMGPLSARRVYPVRLDGSGPVPAGATAVVLNVTAIGPTANGNLRVYPDADGTGSTPPPNASTLNYIPGRDIPNQVVVALPADGKVNFYSDTVGGTVNLAVDVVGYLTPP